MKKWVSIVFSVYLLMASSPFIVVAKQNVSAREGIKGGELLGQGARKFAGNEALEHFTKHGNSVKNILGRKSYSITNYLGDANHIIKNGTWVPELNGYVKLIGGQGKAKYGFVGINRSTGNIATFHIKYAEDLAKVAPSLGIK